MATAREIIAAAQTATAARPDWAEGKSMESAMHGIKRLSGLADK
jgi:hypothetical protein